MENSSYTINCRGRLVELNRPAVMGILNVTGDSFYPASRTRSIEAIEKRVVEILQQGADIIDVGACSTRPGAEPVSCEAELNALHVALDVVDRIAPDAIVSVDTFRGRVVRECVANHNISIINDVSAYAWDGDMLSSVVEAGLPYVLTHSTANSADTPRYEDVVVDTIKFLSQKMWELHQHGVNDVIIDPGFGFGKSVDDNYRLMASLQEFSILEAPLLVGVSRKSMITKILACDVEEALNGTVALNTVALLKGAKILRVHDVAAAVDVVKIFSALKSKIQ